MHGIIPMVLNLGGPRKRAGGAAAVNAYLLTLNPTLYLKYNEASGNIVNYGSDGGAGTATDLTYAQSGPLGAGEAVSYNGTTSKVTVANAAVPATKALTTQRWAFLVKTNSLGESNVGTFFIYEGTYLWRFSTTNRMLVTINTDGTDAQAITANNELSSILGIWAWVFMDYDDGNTLGNGRKIRLFKGHGGTVTAITLATNTAGTGTMVTPVGNLIIGNESGGTQTFDGLHSRAAALTGTWSAAEMQQLVNLAGV